MTKLEQDLALAHALIEDREKVDDYYWQFYRMWPFTTVNMREYLNSFDLKDKKCVTIQGSSDHVFELFLRGAKKIIGVDTNPLTEHYYHLKLAAFAALPSPEAFLRFFRWHDYPEYNKDNYKAFDKEIFKEISKYLVGDSKLFWEDLFSHYEPIQIRKKLFTIDEEDDQTLYKALSYLQRENYEYIRNNRDKIDFTFMNTDVRTLAEELTEQQDFISLSNLIIYAHSMFPDNPAQGFKQLVTNLSKRLNENGQIMAGYLYDIENEEDFREIYKWSLRNSVFRGPEYTYQYVKRMEDLYYDRESENHDGCLIYKKIDRMKVLQFIFGRLKFTHFKK